MRSYMPVEAPKKPTPQPEVTPPVRIIPLPLTPSRPTPRTPIPPFTPIRKLPETPQPPSTGDQRSGGIRRDVSIRLEKKEEKKDK